MKNKSVYHYEKKGLVLSVIILAVLVLINGYTAAPPQWLPANSVWLIGLLCIATVAVAFVVVMYKRVTLLKKHQN